MRDQWNIQPESIVSAKSIKRVKSRLDNNKTVVTWYGPPNLPKGVSGCRANRRSAMAADSHWLSQYLPVDLTSLNVSNSRFRKPVTFWRWHYHGVALWHHGCDAGHNCLLLTTASNINCWADVAIHVTRLWQAGDMENFECRITG